MLLNYPKKLSSCFSRIIFKSLAFLILLSITISASAQKKYTISGTVKDAATGEVLIGATFSIKQSLHSGTTSNSYGFYSLSAPAGKVTLVVTYIGYSPAAFAIKPSMSY
jgi:general stress protein CsbA